MKLNTQLKKHFPILWTRENLLNEIKSNPILWNTYRKWKDYEQEEFLDFCTGVKGVKMTYDSFFKELMSPEYTPERLGDFLSEVFRQKVKVLHTLQNDNVRIADENALLITDIVVELEDGSIVNVEIQKIGYMFPGERAACYSADLLLRQYKRVRSEKKKQFSYRDVKPVYVIVLFEKSPEEFREQTKQYMHHFKACAETEIELNLLQEFYFISLDIYKEKLHNEGVTGKLEAWLTFFCAEEPEYIEKLILAYPEFKLLYEDVYQLCLNTEKVMEMFSEELRMLDVNTTQLMIDIMQERLDEQRGTIDEQRGTIDQQQNTINEQAQLIETLKKELKEAKL